VIRAEEDFVCCRGEGFPRRFGAAVVASRCRPGWQAPRMRAWPGCAAPTDWVRARLSVVVRP
jgi:hypothetical protein